MITICRKAFFMDSSCQEIALFSRCPCTTELESLEAVEKHQPGLLICSDQLEEGDGFSLVVKAKELCPTLRTCIVLSSIDSSLKLALQTKANAIVHELDIGEQNSPFRQAFLRAPRKKSYFLA